MKGVIHVGECPLLKISQIYELCDSFIALVGLVNIRVRTYKITERVPWRPSRQLIYREV